MRENVYLDTPLMCSCLQTRGADGAVLPYNSYALSFFSSQSSDVQIHAHGVADGGVWHLLVAFQRKCQELHRLLTRLAPANDPVVKTLASLNDSFAAAVDTIWT